MNVTADVKASSSFGGNLFSLQRLALYLAFFISGSVGLAYEVVWARQLSLLIGVSIYSVSAVLVAFMGGLGVGAEIFGRMLDKGTRPIRLYAILEISLGLYVFLFPSWLAVMEKTYLLLHPGNEEFSFYVVALRFVLAVLVLIIPTALMGGTLPALSRYMADHEEGSGRLVGKLYAINTLGAMTGCVAAGFFMIERLGLAGTLYAGAAINVTIGILILIVTREQKQTAINEHEHKVSKKRAPHRKNVTLLLLFGISGFCALALELLWTRMLSLLLNNTTYAFALILAVFLLGIGAGSAVTARLAGKPSVNKERFFAFFQIGIGLFALLSLAGLAHSEWFIKSFNSLFGNSPLIQMIPGGERLTTAIIFSLLIVFPCTFLMGGGMPLIVEAVSSGREKLGGEVGRLYAVNTLGAVLGSLIAGYLLIPVMGVHRGVMLIAWIAVASGSYLIWSRSPAHRRIVNALLLIILAPLTLFLFYGGDVGYLLNTQKLYGGTRVLFYEEGPSATVLVSSTPTDMSIGRKPIKRIWINGDPIAGVFREALQLERLQAHIPLLLHSDPKNALVICFGTGSTAGAAIAHGLEDVTAVDISPEVFNAAHYFSEGNKDVMNERSLKLVEDDGRNFLLTSKRKFDFITSEPPPPSNAGVVSLYTREYYMLHKDRLKKGGIVSQWIPLHHLSEDDFMILVATFLDSFRHVGMWYTKWDAIMLGSDEEIVVDIEKIRRGMKIPAVAASLKEIGIDNAFQLVSNYMMNSDQLHKFVKGVKPLHDDRPVVEFSAPRIGERGVDIKGNNLAALLRYRTPPLINFASAKEKELFEKYFESQSLFFAGQVGRSNGENSLAASYFARSLRLNSDNQDARYAFITLNLSAINTAIASGRLDLGLQMIGDTKRLDKEGQFVDQLHFLSGMLLAKADRLTEAENEFKAAISKDEGYFLALVNLAGLYGSRLNRPEEAERLYRTALLLNPTKEERMAVTKALKELNL